MTVLGKDYGNAALLKGLWVYCLHLMKYFTPPHLKLKTRFLNRGWKWEQQICHIFICVNYLNSACLSHFAYPEIAYHKAIPTPPVLPQLYWLIINTVHSLRGKNYRRLDPGLSPSLSQSHNTIALEPNKTDIGKSHICHCLKNLCGSAVYWCNYLRF